MKHFKSMRKSNLFVSHRRRRERILAVISVRVSFNSMGIRSDASCHHTRKSLVMKYEKSIFIKPILAKASSCGRLQNANLSFNFVFFHQIDFSLPLIIYQSGKCLHIHINLKSEIAAQKRGGGEEVYEKRGFSEIKPLSR